MVCKAQSVVEKCLSKQYRVVSAVLWVYSSISILQLREGSLTSANI